MDWTEKVVGGLILISIFVGIMAVFYGARRSVDHRTRALIECAEHNELTDCRCWIEQRDCEDRP